MGNSNIDKYIATENQTFKFQEKKTCKLFGQIKIFKSTQHDKRIFGKVLRFSNQQQCQGFYDLLMKQRKKANKYLLSIYYVRMNLETINCTSINNELNVYFSAFQETLEQRISKRKQNQNNFTELEILTIFETLINGITLIHKQNKFYPELNTQNIVYDFDQTVKINNLILANYINKTGANPNTNKLLNPIFIKTINKNYNQTYYNPFIADIFYMGLILFELLTLKCPNLYQSSSQICRQLNNPREQKYSKILIDVILMMLDQDPKKRPDLQFLKTILIELKNLTN